MTPPPAKPKRFRPRFSIRTLIIALTLVCAYAACWGPTKTRGVYHVEEHVSQANFLVFEPAAVAPLVVSLEELEEDLSAHVRYYFWFFGYVAKLPYERELSDSAAAHRVTTVRPPVPYTTWDGVAAPGESEDIDKQVLDIVVDLKEQFEEVDEKVP